MVQRKIDTNIKIKKKDVSLILCAPIVLISYRRLTNKTSNNVIELHLECVSFSVIHLWFIT